MKHYLFFLLIGINFFFSYHQVISQDKPTAFSIHLEQMDFQNAPALQSYAYGIIEDHWILIGGKTNGLHDHRPPFAFLPSVRNQQIYLVDPTSKEVWSAGVSSLSGILADQLSSTNMAFYQEENILYLVGGYGYSDIQEDWLTHPYLTAVDLEGLKNAILEGNPIQDFFFQYQDDNMAVTGGQLAQIGEKYYLVGGQKFTGRYNPHNGPSFIQEYTNEIRIFDINFDGDQLSIENYSALNDADHLHRRDYNLLPQIFQDGSFGATLFTGVFQYDVDVPWLNIVNIKENDYEVVMGFEQLLNQYHTAHLPVYDSSYNAMHSFFFGGIGMYYADADGQLWVDSLVPFVKTISRVSRYKDGSYEEHLSDQEMPGFLGASAEFMLAPTTPLYAPGIVNLDQLPEEKTLVGYIVGGIESDQKNIFMQMTGSSVATNKVFKVFINKSAATTTYSLQPNAPFKIKCYPNPASDSLTVELAGAKKGVMTLSIFDLQGKIIVDQKIDISENNFKTVINISKLLSGTYYLKVVGNSGEQAVAKFSVTN